jgi:hypothetical protein
LGLRLPTAHSGGEDPLVAGHARVRYVPSSGFGYPLDGFLPLPPRRACFVPTALMGLIPSKRSPRARWLACFHAGRTRVSLARRDLTLANQRTGAPSTDFQALALARVPGRPRGISPRLAGSSLGIFPFQGTTTSRLVQAYARNSPHVLGLKSLAAMQRPHLRVSVSDRLAQLAPQ